MMENVIIESGEQAKRLVAQATLAHSAIPVFWTGHDSAIMSIDDGSGGQYFIDVKFTHRKELSLDEAQKLADKWSNRNRQKPSGERQRDVEALKKEW